MQNYFVARNPNGTFIGRHSIASLLALVQAGQIPRDYVTTEDTGGSYNDVVKSADARWVTVGDLLAAKNSPATESSIASTGTIAPTAGSSSARSRYWDAYLVARATAAIGTVVKSVGIGLGCLILLIAMVMGSQTGGDAQFFVGGLLLAAIVGIPIYVLGVLVSAHAQVLKATLDAAVHSSPFLTKEEMARVMSL